MVRWLAKYSVLFGMVVALSTFAESQSSPCTNSNTVVAHVVALYQPFMYNRLGTAEPQGMIFALESDVVPMTNPVDQYGNDQKLHVDPSQLKSGQVRLRSDKRPRPLALRVNQGQCLEIHFRNLLGSDDPAYLNNTSLTPNTNVASIHLAGLDLVGTIQSDGSWVGQNKTSFARPNGKEIVYTYYAPAEGTFILYSTGDIENTGNGAGQMVNGMFGAVNVQPAQAEYYRSQVTREDLQLATFNSNNLPSNMSVAPRPSRGPKQGIMGQVCATMRASVFFSSSPSSLSKKLTLPKQTIYVLTTTTPGASQTTDVVVDPTGNIYALEPGQQAQYYPCMPISPTVTALTAYPIINYAAQYPAKMTDGRACYPILKMAASVDSTCVPVGFSSTDSNPQLFYSDLTAIITGPQAGPFPATGNPPFNANYAEPNRTQPYREFTIIYHNPAPVQAFEQFDSPELSNVLNAASDGFAINYGIAGIGAEILANRLGVGPEGNADAVDLKFEEFFLTSWAVGDPAMVVDVPANAQNEVINNSSAQSPCPTSGYSPGCATVANSLLVNEPKDQGWTSNTNQSATKAYYPDDPSNVYHSYMSDHVKFRISHAGIGATHVHHLHAHQWLHSPNSPDSQYLDSQMLTPGASYTLEIDYGGSGNRNHTVGDSIFHCHFYPHFAGGMWSLWRVHDVIEEGTVLGADGIPVSGVNRVLPDGEIRAGTPIPAVVPVPTLAMAPFPADVQLADALVPGDHRRIQVLTKTGQPASSNPHDYTNPGFPFFVPGVAGHRAPHPPLDFAQQVINGNTIELNGGLPRHLVLNGTIYREFHTNWDFTRDFVLYDSHHNLKAGNLVAFQLPEAGTAVEQAAMAAHEKFNGGLTPISGAPFAPPDVGAFIGSKVNTRIYKGANIQTDVVLNKKGWHFPQQRFITLWSDVQPTIAGKLPPQPLFFRAASGENVEYWHTNLVPNYYEMDDFEVRTPTDIIGQHIHLVKFDVLASDGSSNGFNYEDGTFSPDEVQERIYAINNSTVGGLYPFNSANQFYNPGDKPNPLTLHSYVNDYPIPGCTQNCPSIFGQPPAGQNWDGAQTTIQRWGVDPLCDLNSVGADPLCSATGSKGFDRTLRTVFTHDHFGPSTHQQAGLYAGLVVEPAGSTWKDSTTGQTLYDTTDCYDPANPMVKYSAPPCKPNTYPRMDGGPTTWQANISDSTNSYREFALEFQDLQLAYTNQSVSQTAIPTTPLFSFPASATDTPGNNALNALSNLTSKTSVPVAVNVIFSRNGITLSNQAQVEPSSMDPSTQCTGAFSGGNLEIIDPVPNEEYCIATTSSSDSVFLPDMEPGWSDPTHAINSPSGSTPTPTIISSALNGTYSLNYRNEPVPLRVNPSADASPPSWCTAGTANANATDLSYAFSSILRNDPCLNFQPPGGTQINPSDTTTNAFTFPPPLVPSNGPTAAQGTDPFTPMLRAYQGDKVQIRTLVGAHLSLHSFHIPGINWMFEPTPAGAISSGASANYGFRNTQGMGISEHWEMLFDLPYTTTTAVSLTPTTTTPYSTDYVYEADAGVDGVTNGLWGILRAFDPSKPPKGGYPDLQPLPNNPMPSQTAPPSNPCSGKQPDKSFQVVAISAAEALSSQCSINSKNVPCLIYNTRGQQQNPGGFADPNALIYVRKEDLDTSGTQWALNPNVPIEPLILRANAGSCIQVTLTNHLPGPSTAESFATNILQSTPFGLSQGADIAPSALSVSSSAAVIPSLLFYDPNTSGGMGFNVGFNNQQTANASGGTATVTWFAGHADGTPMEAGTVLLEPSDPLLQHFTGLAGVMVIEPQGASWQEDANTRAAATVTLTTPVTKADGTQYSQFRELVLMGQNDVQNQNLTVQAAPDGVQAALNYRSEPFGASGSPDVYRWPLSTQPPVGGAAQPKTLNDVVTLLQQTNRSLTLSSLARKSNGKVPGLDLADAIPSVHAASKAAASNQSVDPITGRYSNDLVKNDTDTDNNPGQPGDPKTPILYTGTGMPVRIHMAFAGGSANAPGVFTIHGHQWQEEPWTNNSTSLGSNLFSQIFGMEQIVPYQVLNVLLDYAGGKDGVKGDYLYEMFQQKATSQGGMWGLLRVQDVSVVITQASTTQVAGSVMVKPGTTMPTLVTVTSTSGIACIDIMVNPNGSWACSIGSSVGMTAGSPLTATTAQGGSYTAIVR